MTYFKINRDPNATLATDGTIGKSRFTQLLALGLFDIIITLPLQVIDLVLVILQNSIVGFWPGWQTVHTGFSNIPMLTSNEWKTLGFWTVFNVRFFQLVNPIYGFTFFLIFGLTETKRAWYRSIFGKVLRPIGLMRHVDTVLSTIGFGSGPAVNSGTDGTRVTTLWVSSLFRSHLNKLFAPSYRANESVATSYASERVQSGLFANGTISEDARQEPFGTKTVFLSPSNEHIGEV